VDKWRGVTWLELATDPRYKRLDEAVLEAYGWPREAGDDRILASR